MKRSCLRKEEGKEKGLGCVRNQKILYYSSFGMHIFCEQLLFYKFDAIYINITTLNDEL